MLEWLSRMNLAVLHCCWAYVFNGADFESDKLTSDTEAVATLLGVDATYFSLFVFKLHCTYFTQIHWGVCVIIVVFLIS